MRAAIGLAYDIDIDHVWLSNPGRIPKTTSGKTRYEEIRKDFAALPASERAGGLILSTRGARAVAADDGATP